MDKEYEVKFLEINKDEVVKKLLDLGAEDKGRHLMSEIIFYDKDGKWMEEKRFARIRKKGEKVTVTYKHYHSQDIDGVEEIEFVIADDVNKIKKFFEYMGMVAYRSQEKYRHTLVLDGVTFDIDEWPGVPAYLEVEGNNEDEVKKGAKMLDFNYENATHFDAAEVLKKYNIDIFKLKRFTFEGSENL